MDGRETDAEAWFASRGWLPFAFQREVWAAMARGRSGLLHATTGSGKTYAVWLGALARSSSGWPAPARKGRVGVGSRRSRRRRGLQVLWLTPMRALAADTARALELPLPDMAPDWTVGLRTGDTAGSERATAGPQAAQALVTTPESLTLLLTRADARERTAQRAHGGRRRVARDDRQQARRAGAAGAGAPAALEPAARGVGAVGHARQPGRRDAACCWRARGRRRWCRAASTSR